MTDIKYIDIIHKIHDKHWIRRQVVENAKKFGIKTTARKFSCSKNTVKKWFSRYKLNPRKKLDSLSTRPKKTPLKMDIFWEGTIVTTCEDFVSRNKRINSKQLQKKENIPYSIKTIRKVMIKNGFSKINKKKQQRKKDLWSIKKKMRAFEKVQVDLKYLDDIPELYEEYYSFGLPRYQYTARCVKTGALFICYAQEISVTNTSTFIHLLARHFLKNKINLKKVIIQTDNGVEFTNGWNYKSISRFTKTVNSYGMKHYRIPPKACTFNSDVEASHRLIEDEFYSFESFSSYKDFFKKAHRYQNDFNFKRKNTHKDNKTPIQLLRDELPNKHKKILNFTPLLLDKKWDDVKMKKIA